MHWRESWTYGVRELVTDAPTRQQEQILGRVEMCRGRIVGFVPNGCCSERVVADQYLYDDYRSPKPERYRAVELAVEEAANEA